MNDIAEQTSRSTYGRINDSLLSRVGVVVANSITAATVIVLAATLVYFAANTIDADVNGLSAQSGPGREIGASFSPELLNIAGGVFAYGMAVLAASGLLGLLARLWRRGPLLPVLHVVLALAIAVPTYLGALLLQGFFIVFAFPFPVLALAILVVWSTTIYPVSDASPDQLPFVRYRMRRRIDIAAAIAVGVQFAAPVVLLLISTFAGS